MTMPLPPEATEKYNALYPLILEQRASQELSSLLQKLIEQAIRLLEGSGGSVYFCDHQRRVVICQITSGTKQDYANVELAFGEGAAGTIAQTGQPLIIDDYRIWPNRALIYEQEKPFIGVLGAPMVWQGQVTGVLLVLHYDEQRQFTQKELEILTLFADQAAIALVNSALLSAERKRREEAETLRDIAQVISANLHPEEILHVTLHQLQRLIQFDSASLLMLPAGQHPSMVAGIGFEDEVLTRESGNQVLANSPLLLRMAQDLQPILLEDVTKEPDWRKVKGAEQIRAFIAVPILSRGQMIGALTVDSLQPGTFTRDDLRSAEGVSQHLAIAIENSTLWQAKQAQLLLAQTLQEVGALLTSELDLHEVLDTILELLGRVLHYDSASIQLLNAEGNLDLAAYCNLPDYPNRFQYETELGEHALQKKWTATQVIVIPDTENHPLWMNVPGFEYIRSWIGAPLLVQGKFIGCLNVDSSLPNAYGPEMGDTVLAFANQAAVAITNARLFQQANTESRHLSLLYDVSRELATSLEADEILTRAIPLITHALGATFGQVFRFLPEKGILQLSASFRQDGAMSEKSGRAQSFRLGEGLTGWVGAHQKAVCLPEVSQDSRWVYRPDLEDNIAAAICAPILGSEGLLGVLTLLHHQSGAFTPHHLSMVETLCQELSLALSNAQRYQEVQRRLADLTLIQSLTQACTKRLEIQTLLNELVNQLVERSGYTQVEVFLCQGEWLIQAAFSGLPAIIQALPKTRGIVGRSARSERSVLVLDVRLDPDYIQSNPSTISELAVPIFQAGEVFGVINIETDQPERLLLQDLEVVEVLSGQISVAIENARLYERVRSHAEELERTVVQRTAELTELYQLSQEIGYQLSYRSMLHLLLHHLRVAIPCDWAMTCLFSADAYTLHIETCRPLGPAVLQEIQSAWEKTLQSSETPMMSGKRPQLEIIRAEDYASNAPAAVTVGDSLRVNVMAQEKAVGLLMIGSEQGHVKGPQQERLLTLFAQQVSSAKERLEMMLAAQQRDLQSLLDHIPVGTLLYNQNYHLLAANPLGQELLRVLNENQPDFSPDRLGPYLLKDLIPYSRETLPVEIRLPGSPSRIFTVQVKPVGSEEMQWVVSLQEVTQERENQARILSQERLATVGQLAAGIAHDFNNIMAAILVYADLLQADPFLQGSSRDKLQIIEQQVQRASSLIRQILDFSRRSVMDQSTLDLLPFIKELDKLLGRILPESIRLELTYQPGNYYINADPTRLQQVFMNLALNARDAMPEGGSLRFELERFTLFAGEVPPFPGMAPGPWVNIRVSDSGCGIPLDVRPHIFEPFFTTKPVGQGTGLGLAQVYGIIKQHDGYIDIGGEEGQGAVFLIYLPLVQPPTSWQPSQESGEIPKGSGEQLLVVEDDSATREALKALLEAHQYRVFTAADGVEALSIYQNSDSPISLVISDVVMPRMGGIALFRELQKLAPDLRILFMTGHPLEEENQSLLEQGRVHWLMKPLSVREFTQAIYHLLHKA